MVNNLQMENINNIGPQVNCYRENASFLFRFLAATSRHADTTTLILYRAGIQNAVHATFKQARSQSQTFTVEVSTQLQLFQKWWIPAVALRGETIRAS